MGGKVENSEKEEEAKDEDGAVDFVWEPEFDITKQKQKVKQKNPDDWEKVKVGDEWMEVPKRIKDKSQLDVWGDYRPGVPKESVPKEPHKEDWDFIGKVHEKDKTAKIYANAPDVTSIDEETQEDYDDYMARVGMQTSQI